MSSDRQDKNYIYDENNQPNKFANIITFLRYRWLLLLLLVMALISCILIVLRFSAPIKEWRPTEYFAIFTLILSTATIIEESYKSFSKRQYRINCNLSIAVLKDKHIKITASVQNTGTVKIEPYNISIFLDEGTYNTQNKKYEFPFLLKHEKRGNKHKYDCILSDYCQSGYEYYPTDMVDNNTNGTFETTFRMCYKLQHLSADSILYIGSGETFTEDIIIKLNDAGAYRAILIITAKNKACDCICTSKQFIVP